MDVTLKDILVMFLLITMAVNQAKTSVALKKEFNNTNVRGQDEKSSDNPAINKGLVIAIVFLAIVFSVIIVVLIIRFCCIRRANVHGSESMALTIKPLVPRATMETSFNDLERITAAEQMKVDKICIPSGGLSS